MYKMCKCEKKQNEECEIKYAQYLSSDECFFYFKELVCNKKEDKCEKKEDECTAKHCDLKIRKAKFCNPPTFVENSYYELKSVVESKCKCCNDVWYTATLLTNYYLNKGSIQSLYPCDEACKDKVTGIRGQKVDAMGEPQVLGDVLFVDVCKSRKCNPKCNVYYGIHYLKLRTETVCDVVVDYGMIICYTKSCDINNSVIFPLV
jgi:hypothetical protein